MLKYYDEPIPQTKNKEKSIEEKTNIPAYDPSNGDAFQIDLRFADVSGIDLRESADALFHSAFSTATVWPEALPDGFDPALMMEYGKDPGLGLRELHERGYTGKGVSIAIIDQNLDTAHSEYSDSIAYYENLSTTGGIYAAMHGCAVASLAVGKNIGVAPDANLFFFATPWGKSLDYTFRSVAEALDRIIEINTLLPENERIRSVSIARGIRGEPSTGSGHDEVMAAISRAEDAGIFVITTLMDSIGFSFTGLDRDSLSDPNDPNSYSYPYWWSNADTESMKRMTTNRIGFPMGARTYAGFTGPDMYEFGVFGGYSWSVPYINGLYAIAVQIDSSITPQVFWDTLTETAQTTVVEFKGEQIEFTIANPPALVDALEARLK